ncbi:MAG TPA: hypothetical protein VFQ68_10525 [Streptosporangiaceae bacterium]|nr:hypothetical protein [Streptosporangiaceae bacterium]
MAGLVSVVGLAAGCGGGSAAPVSTVFPGAAAPAGAWPDPDGDIGNTRVGPDSVISAANVSGLREAWAFKLSGPGRGRRLGDRLADRAAGRAGRRRVPPGRGRQRVRAVPRRRTPPLAVFGNTVLVPAGGPKTSASGGGSPQLVAYTVR